MADRGDKPDAAPGGRAPPTSADLIEAALGYAVRGWPVFPCNPANKQPLLGADKDEAGKPIRGTGGLKKASTDPEQISAWWKRWPHALIGLCTGHPTKGTECAIQPAGLRLFVLDFDPREDPETGEVWSLERLKRETEEQLGCALPQSMAGMTPSDGVHLYLLIGDDGPSITNRGNLPDHVDVRGLGGYVIAAPSVMSDGRRYRWYRREPIGGISKAPQQLLEVLRSPKGKPSSHAAPEGAARFAGSPTTDAKLADAAVRKYALAAFDEECRLLAGAPMGDRNNQINSRSFVLGQLVGAGALSEAVVRSALQSVVSGFGRDYEKCCQAIDNGLAAGMAQPRDLSDVATNARRRAESRSSHSSARPLAEGRSQGQPFQSGSQHAYEPPQGPGDGLSDSDHCRLRRIAEAWLDKRLDDEQLTPDNLKQIAWGCGRRIASGHLDELTTRDRLRSEALDVAGVTLDELDQAIADGAARGFDPRPSLLDLECGRYPMTDFGLAERFRDRFGSDFRFTTAKGWLGWDGKRWKSLDQDKDTPPAELITAVFETVRLVQREARRIRETGERNVLRIEGKREFIDEDGEPLDAALDYWMPKGRSFIRYSAALAAWGRSCEVAGKPASIGALARRWLTVPIEQFDCEQMAINAENGTLRFAVERLPDGKRKVAVSLSKHRREDLITRLAPVTYDRDAKSALYDAMIAWAQPDPAVRRYVHQVGGYSCSGDTGEHLLWFNYGRGRNGKSVTIDSWCSALGDYSGTIGIESFLDQGIKKRGDAATPDLAKLGGVRMLRASEPERGAKLNSALIKAATGGEPMSVRALHRGFFDLQPRFKLLMSGNSKPGIPDTDEGIWGRMRLVPWKRHIEQPDEDPYRDTFPAEAWPTKDPKLLDKIKANELAGVFARLVTGLADYLEHGFIEPEGVRQATADYRNQSDPLGRFLELCTEPDPQSRVKSSELHDVFAAWCKAAGEKEWSPVGFANAMIDKGFTKVRSDGMRWEGLRLLRQVSDFVDAEGKVRILADDLTKEPKPPPRAEATVPVEDDDLPY